MWISSSKKTRPLARKCKCCLILVTTHQIKDSICAYAPPGFCPVFILTDFHKIPEMFGSSSLFFFFCRALTEKIVSVLPKMKCPHRLEPHQIQGLDFIHIFPVIQVRQLTHALSFRRPCFDRVVCESRQWLVKRAIETREEMGDYVRAFSISQFQKTHRLPEVRTDHHRR